MSAEIVTADVMEWCKSYDGPKAMALLCDPPYHLTDPRSPCRASPNPKVREAHKQGGFMGKAWDGGGIAFDPETWAALAEHLHPGAFGMAFASSRGWHRLAVAIEDAGLRIHPSIFGWSFGSGFPKATRIDMQVDKAAGAERPVIGTRMMHTPTNGGNFDDDRYDWGEKHQPVSGPATDLARAWVGHRYGLQCLKPALEPVIVFQVPYKGKPVECIVETGAGALWIDGGRIGTEDCRRSQNVDSEFYGQATGHGQVTGSPSGRWPANFFLDEEGARRLGQQSGGVRASGHYDKGCRAHGLKDGPASIPIDGDLGTSYSDTGTAARFFFNVNTALDEADPVLYCAKASRKEREVGLLGQVPCSGVKNPRVVHDEDPLWSTRHYMLDDDGNPKRGKDGEIAWSDCCRCDHPTVKPIDLTRWLATLLLPPAEYAPRRLLVPFAGVASEMCGAHLAGWEEIVGIEGEREHVEIARARLAHWTKRIEQMELVIQHDD